MWVYVLPTGTLYDSSGTVRGVGYSGGNCGKNPEGINNPADEGIPDIGPIPEGQYTIGQVFTHPKAGPLCMRLYPAATNNERGRSGMMMHGDTAIAGHASEGCIIMPRATRVLVSESADRQLLVALEFTKAA